MKAPENKRPTSDVSFFTAMDEEENGDLPRCSTKKLIGLVYHCALLVYIRMKAVRIDPVSTRKFRGRGFGEIKPGFTRLVLNQYKQGCKNGLQFRPALYLFPILALLPFHSH